MAATVMYTAVPHSTGPCTISESNDCASIAGVYGQRIWSAVLWSQFDDWRIPDVSLTRDGPYGSPTWDMTYPDKERVLHTVTAVHNRMVCFRQAKPAHMRAACSEVMVRVVVEVFVCLFEE